MSTATSFCVKKRSASRKNRGNLRARLEALRQREIDFIPNPAFDAGSATVDQEVLNILDSVETATAPGAVGRFGEREVLSPEDETALFREMNRLKHIAYELRERLSDQNPTTPKIDKIETLLRDAGRIRDHIIESNLRLVISLAKKFISPHATFDDLVSEGTLTLMKAVEKFDYDRGFRFSTYAYRSIARDAYRMVTSASKEESRTIRQAEEWVLEQEQDLGSSRIKEKVWSNLRERMETMVEQLDRRERFIVRSRYALGAHRKTRSLKDLGDRLGVSKERARQLEKRAVAKLKAMASDLDLDLDQLFGAAIA